MIQLRAYQQKAKDVVVSLSQRKNSVCVVMPPGGGKTVMGSEAALDIAQMRKGKVLWVAHRKELIKQAASTLSFALQFRPGIIAPWAKPEPEKPVFVGSVQTIVRNLKVIPDGIVVVVWDECHHAMGDDWNLLARECKRLGAFLLGLTATPERADGKGLKGTFSNLVVAARQRDLISKGFLVPTDVFVPPVAIRDGLADMPVKLWEKHAKGSKTIVFCSSVDHAIQVAEEFQQKGYRAAHVEGGMDSKQRTRTIEKFIHGRLDIITNCQILTEGFDLPPIETTILARSVGSTSLYLQMVGRGSRPFPGKKRSLCLDLAGNAIIYGSPDADRTFSLQGRPIRLSETKTGKKLRSKERRCPNCKVLLAPIEHGKFRTRSAVCPRCGLRAKEPKLHGRALRPLPTDKQMQIEKAFWDRLTDYAARHGKPATWAEDKFITKFGKARDSR